MRDEEQIDTPPPELRVEVGAATLAGARALNADAHLIDEAAGFFGVADGMHDLPRSREVALAALDIVAESFEAPWGSFPHPARTAAEAGERLMHGMACAHAQLFEPSPPRRARIGTTLAGAVACSGGMLSAAHVGNSRIYLLRRARPA